MRHEVTLRTLIHQAPWKSAMKDIVSINRNFLLLARESAKDIAGPILTGVPKATLERLSTLTLDQIDYLASCLPASGITFRFNDVEIEPEIIKIAAVMNAKLFELLENISDKELLNHNSQAFKYILKQAVKNKLEIVRQDEHEAGLRRILNFGHTLAHAIEPIYSMSHGTSVAIGIVFATKLAERYYGADPSISNRITAVLKKAKNLYDCKP